MSVYNAQILYFVFSICFDTLYINLESSMDISEKKKLVIFQSSLKLPGKLASCCDNDKKIMLYQKKYQGRMNQTKPEQKVEFPFQCNRTEGK